MSDPRTSDLESVEQGLAGEEGQTMPKPNELIYLQTYHDVSYHKGNQI
jgi:hypothetical protein